MGSFPPICLYYILRALPNFLILLQCYYHCYHYCCSCDLYCRRAVCSIGCPKQYTAKAEAAAARAASKKQYKQQKQQLENQLRFVAYMLVLLGVPSITLLNFLLRSDCIGQSTAQTLQSYYIQDSSTSVTKQAPPLLLPLPLPLQPLAFHLQEEEEEVSKQQEQPCDYITSLV